MAGQPPYLSPLRRRGPQLPAQDLLEDIREEADGDEQCDAQPGRPAGQHVYEYIVHPLIAEEWPGRGGTEDTGETQPGQEGCHSLMLLPKPSPKALFSVPLVPDDATCVLWICLSWSL